MGLIFGGASIYYGSGKFVFENRLGLIYLEGSLRLKIDSASL